MREHSPSFSQIYAGSSGLPHLVGCIKAQLTRYASLWLSLCSDPGPPGCRNQVNFSLRSQGKGSTYGRVPRTHHGKAEKGVVSQCGERRGPQSETIMEMVQML